MIFAEISHNSNHDLIQVLDFYGIQKLFKYQVKRFHVPPVVRVPQDENHCFTPFLTNCEAINLALIGKRQYVCLGFPVTLLNMLFASRL